MSADALYIVALVAKWAGIGGSVVIAFGLLDSVIEQLRRIARSLADIGALLEERNTIEEVRDDCDDEEDLRFGPDDEVSP